MRLLVTATKLGGYLVPASFACDASIDFTPGGNAVLMIGGRRVPPGTEQVAHCEILEASPIELSHLRRSGYRLSFSVLPSDKNAHAELLRQPPRLHSPGL